MKKPNRLKKGDKVAIVSLSLGILGEDFTKHQREIAEKRMKEMGLEVVYMPNSTKGIKYLDENPDKRAEDLKEAFKDDSIKAIMTAIGGMDTYRTYEYLFEDEEFKDLVVNKPKLFTGFSDTTMNHLMFQKLGLNTFYGPAYLVDIAELEDEMLPYTKEYFNLYFDAKDEFEIRPSEYWYFDREDHGVDQVGVKRKKMQETKGYEVLNGSGKFSGKLYGGCLDTIGDALLDLVGRGVDKIVEKYEVLPTIDEWKEKILFVETAGEKMKPERLELILNEFKKRGVLSAIQGVIVGKPTDETYYEEYKEVYKKVFSDLDTPILYNVNFGHAYPRAIIPYGIETEVDLDNKKIIIKESIFND
ncbi:S66 family peptidase [Helcococcus sueciensis]|uniref:S66 family peptidase n=1 Tax=Helcococcus sueciensis TaxID=241555 RepID=UPI00041CDAB6|nr:S66 peptidase family protein [Helcococcus sueciensis]